MISNVRVGIAATGGRGWLGGVSFIELLVKALARLPRNERPEIVLIISETTLADYDLFRPSADQADSVLYIGPKNSAAESVLGDRVLWCQTYDELFARIDLYFPLNSRVSVAHPAISWIPDFQHQYLPEFFSQSELTLRDTRFKEIADNAKMVVFSSEAVQADFWKTYPDSKAITAVLNYRLMQDRGVYLQDAAAVQVKYQLPDQFVLCCNQFWVHKNHKILLEAVALMRRQGREIHLVCTGRTQDYRWPNYFTELVEYIRQLGIEDLVHILGLIPREDQLQLLRRCQCIVQPSLFEGLSLIVCEARSLGKPMVISDIPVHREQQYGVYFDPGNVEELAEVINDVLAWASPGPDLQNEYLALQDAESSVIAFAKEFCQVAETAVTVYEVASLQRCQNITPKTITVATSLTPGNLSVQRSSVDSWRRLGFTVASLNAADEIEKIQPLYPDVEFIQVQRDARQQYGKPFIYFDDLILYLQKQGSEICGIVNSDIIIDHPGIRSYIENEAKDSLLFGCRIDVPSLEVRDGTVNIGGYDYFFFNRNIMHCYPQEEFCIGLPWWDYWVIFWPIANGMRTKKIITPVAFHLRHETSWGGNSWFPLGQNFSSHVTVPFPINTQTMIDFQRIIHQFLENQSEHVVLT